jgi:hypothetical protein
MWEKRKTQSILFVSESIFFRVEENFLARCQRKANLIKLEVEPWVEMNKVVGVYRKEEEQVRGNWRAC